MATLYTHQDQNIRKTWFLMAVFFIVVMGIGWVFSYVLNSPAILYIAVVFSVGMNIFSYWNSDKIVLKISGAMPAQKETHRELYTLVENLSITAGLPMPRVYIIPDSAPNAFATGRDSKHAAIAVTVGLLSLLNRAELEGVLAHELSHIGNRDILISTIVVVLVGFITLLSDFFLRSTFWGFGHGNDRDSRLQIILLLVGIVLAILAPIVAVLIQLAISRKREFLADASGALLTRYPEGLASALRKISGNSAELKRANRATAHLYIANPFRGKKSHNILGKLFMTHPSTEDRIRALIGR